MVRTTHTEPPPSRTDRPARPRRRTGWIVWGSLITVVLCVLVVEAYANSEFVPDHVREVGDQAGVPTAIRSGGPVIDTTEGRRTSYHMPPRTIALTFDDGPDPVWTPQVLDVLRRHQAPATFFVVGSQVARHSDLARRIAAEGHELGVHTFSHPDATLLSDWRRRLEYAQTQQAIMSAAGVRTSLLRFPYSSTPDAVDDEAWAAIQEAGRLGYLTAVNDTDSRDWAKPGLEAVVRNMTPPAGQGAVVLLHDAGGDRSQTVAALDRFIPMMMAQGYHFTTISGGVNQSLAMDGAGTWSVAGNVPVSALDRWRAGAIVLAVNIADLFLAALRVLFVVVEGEFCQGADCCGGVQSLEVEFTFLRTNDAVRMLEDGLVQPFLVGEVVVDHALGGVSLGCDLVYPGAGESLVGKLLGGDGDDVHPGQIAVSASLLRLRHHGVH